MEHSTPCYSKCSLQTAQHWHSLEFCQEHILRPTALQNQNVHFTKTIKKCRLYRKVIGECLHYSFMLPVGLKVSSELGEGKNTLLLKLNFFKISQPLGPGRVAPLVGASSRAPEGCGFHPQLRNNLDCGIDPWSGRYRRQPIHVSLSSMLLSHASLPPSFSLSLPPLLSKINKHILE